MKTSNHFNDVVGIIGGVGPEATNYFTSLLVKLRQEEATKDQDHVPFLVFNNPQIPDRSSYFNKNTESPLSELVRTGKILKEAGATFLVIPCNSSHGFIDEIEKILEIEVINMIKLTAKHIVEKFGRKAKVGLLATDATLLSKTYPTEFAKIAKDITLITPDSEDQKKVMEAIYNIKSDSVNSYNIYLLNRVAEKLMKQGASVIVHGCTEIPVAMAKTKIAYPSIDPMELTAKKIIDRTIASKVSNESSLTVMKPFNLAIVKHTKI
jgi:aspartate racemase